MASIFLAIAASAMWMMVATAAITSPAVPTTSSPRFTGYEFLVAPAPAPTSTSRMPLYIVVTALLTAIACAILVGCIAIYRKRAHAGREVLKLYFSGPEAAATRASAAQVLVALQAAYQQVAGAAGAPGAAPGAAPALGAPGAPGAT